MKYTLTTLNIKRLLDGGCIMNVTKKFRLDDNFKDRDTLQKYLDDEDMRKKYRIVYDTEEGGVLILEPKE